ncbi:MAG TPA: hypothetical protein VE871_10000 [Longimicrobium sp.]|nr:hypothetical protein [Longimicrobium sp.]
MAKTVLSIDDLTVDSFTTANNPAELSDEWTGCMSDCGAEGCA